MAVEVDRFERDGYQGRINLEPRPSGTLDGTCVIFENGVAIDSCCIDPMISNQKEAVAMLRRAGEEMIDRQLQAK